MSAAAGFIADLCFVRHQKAHEYFVKRIEKEGTKLLVPPGRRIPNLNTVCVPDGVDDPKTRKRLLTEKGIEIAGRLRPPRGQNLPHRRDGSTGDGKEC